MKYRDRIVTATLIVPVLVACGAAVWYLVKPKPAESAKPAPAAAPATVAKPLKEDQVQAVTLTEEAMQRLALDTRPVQRKPVPRVRVYGGEVMVPAGQSVVVSAPLTGIVRAAAGAIPQPGQTVKRGQPVFQLLPLLTPEARANLTASKVEAEGLVLSAQTQLDAARIARDRAKRVFQSEAGSQRAVDEAQAHFDLAQKSLEAAIARRNLLGKVVGEIELGTAGPLAIECPQDGLLRNVSALADQNVPAGSPLFEVMDLSRVWVRVAVYVGDLPAVDPTAAALVGNLTARPGEPGQRASPVAAPPSANPAAGTVDCFYELDNRTTRYSPGQRVGVTVLLKSEAQSLTVPWAAVIHDIHGGTWVYEQKQTDPRVFERRRVTVRYVVGDTAVLASGPAEHAKVVTAGAAELFGDETGFTK
jgi:RND family efflux transporter MFP subunit